LSIDLRSIIGLVQGAKRKKGKSQFSFVPESDARNSPTASRLEDTMTRTKLDDLQESTTKDELIDLADEQLAHVLGGNGTGATNVVTGGGDSGGNGGGGPAYQ
jgi:hypothetical protein